MNFSRWTVALYVGLVFASGIVVGAYGHRLTEVSAVSANAGRNPEEFRKRFNAEMKSRLKLTGEQITRLDAILEQTREEFRATRDGLEPALQKIREEQHQRILGILEPDQRAEYETMRKEREERIRQRNQATPPPPRY
jgi:Spy/CpxP family protein refolding chaperone